VARSKIVDEQEVVRWFAEGKTYQEMQRLYLEKYNIETVLSMWGNFRRRRGLSRRINRDDDLIPWNVKIEHRWDYAVAMLRDEARRRRGFELNTDRESRLNSWLRSLEERGVVVHYDPGTEKGFSFVPRENGDDDVIRRPSVKTTLRKAAD
jgi:hypothetical protein